MANFKSKKKVKGKLKPLSKSGKLV